MTTIRIKIEITIKRADWLELQGQKDTQSRAFALERLDFDLAAMGLDDAADDG